MEISSDFIYGCSLGAEYVPASYEADIEFPCLVLDLLFIRVIVEFTGE